MTTFDLFHFSGFNILLVAIGASILISMWLPRFIRNVEPASSFLILVLGAFVFSLVPNMPETIDPVEAPSFWEATSELAVISALFGAGLRIDTKITLGGLGPTLRLLLIAMPLTIGAVMLVGWGVAGLSLGVAIVMGAALAPTDPVLAGDLQVGPPQEGREHPARFILTTEAGLNDGLAFPFVYLGLLVVLSGFAPQTWGVEWLGRDVLYRIVVGLLAGAAMGWALGKMIFDFPRNNPLADKGAGIIGMAVLLLSYGCTQLIGGYGFIAAFVAGVVLRRQEAEHNFHRKLHDFSEALEHALTVFLLFLLGGSLPQVLSYLTWQLALISVILVFLIRPVVGWLSLAGSGMEPGPRALISFYGVRGIGSIYYVAFACTHSENEGARELWATTALTILLSTFVHGLSSGFADQYLSRNEEQPAKQEE